MELKLIDMALINIFPKIKIFKLSIFYFIVTFGISNLVQAQSINLSYNGVANADKNAVHLFASNLKAIVEKNSNGKIEINLYPNSILGKEQERMEQVINSPGLNIASFGGISPIFPEIFVSSIPFLFTDFEKARKFFDEGYYWKKARTEFYQRNNAHILAVVEEGGFLAFTNNEREIRTPADFKGLKFRAMDKSQVALYKSFGASGTPIPWTDVYMALKMGVADGQMNPPMYIIMSSLNEVQHYLTLANIQYSDQFLVANDTLMKNLTEKQREILIAAVKEANALNRKSIQSQVESRIDYLSKNGMQVYQPTEEEIEQFRNASKESYINWLETQGIDKSWIDLALKDVN
ncbi:TRAP transporter substrate-binding protein DctP [Vibrio tetraodonis]|uniref:TRAP transporter substrate-binding protein n=1 Tax=Vibrio tetraodonis TaxID=2231647 RepID=UPI001F07EB7F|nr:TRAP transporter substrate-binding protein DctP [Vibrio tetraodonis]